MYKDKDTCAHIDALNSTWSNKNT